MFDICSKPKFNRKTLFLFTPCMTGTRVRMMAIVGRVRQRPRLYCDFALGRYSTVSYYEMSENHGRKYGSFILSCDAPRKAQVPPCFITVVKQSAGGKVDGTVQVPVRTLRPKNSTAPHSFFTLCVPPLYGHIPPAKLVEFFEVRPSETLCYAMVWYCDITWLINDFRCCFALNTC